MDYKKIDLHMHTTISDGTDSLQLLLQHVRDAGIDLFAVTDHDAIKGGLMMPDLLQEGDPSFIRGVEFSCRDDDGKYHILGYGYDPEGESIRQAVEFGHAMRMKKTKARIDFLQETFDMKFPQEEIQALLALDNPGKPHIAKMMIRAGYAATIREAMDNFINKKKFHNVYLDPGDAITAILGSGGIPVLAHPTYGSGDELILGEEMEQRLDKLVGYGLAGVEAFYSGFTPKIIRQVLDFAEEYQLYVTAGSDYHGSNKLVELAETNLEDMSDAPEGMLRFLADVSIIRKSMPSQTSSR